VFEWIRLEWRYLFHRMTILLFGILICFYLFALVYSSGILDGSSTMDLFRISFGESYVQEIIVIIKFLYIILVVFITVLMQAEGHRNLGKYIIDHPKKKLQFYLSTLLFQFLVATAILILFALLFISYTKMFTPYALPTLLLKDYFTWLLLEGILFLTMTNTLLILLPHIFVGLLPIIIFWVMETNRSKEWIDSSAFLSLLYKYLPNIWIENNQLVLYGVLSNYIFFFFICLFFGLTLQVRKDIL